MPTLHNLLKAYLILIVPMLIASLLHGLSREAACGGLLHVFPPRVEDDSVAVARPLLTRSRTIATVSESGVEYRIDQTFFNDNDFALSGLFLYRFADGGEGVREGTRLRIDGFPAEFEIFGPDELFPLLKDLTLEMRDPSLLGAAGSHVLLVKDLKIGVK
ncbi:MAG: hypothetical protein V2B18_21385, partial [Pseudomonadota bacterium]